jgi:hypothetical protein
MKALIGIMAAAQVHEEQERKRHLDRNATNSHATPWWRRIERTLIFS